MTTELDQLLALNQSNKPRRQLLALNQSNKPRSSLHVSPKNKNVTTDTEILTELDQLLALNQSNKPSSLHVSPNKNVTTDTEILDKLTQQIEHLKRSFPISNTFNNFTTKTTNTNEEEEKIKLFFLQQKQLTCAKYV